MRTSSHFTHASWTYKKTFDSVSHEKLWITVTEVGYLST